MLTFTVFLPHRKEREIKTEEEREKERRQRKREKRERERYRGRRAIKTRKKKIWTIKYISTRTENEAKGR